MINIIIGILVIILVIIGILFYNQVSNQEITDFTTPTTEQHTSTQNNIRDYDIENEESTEEYCTVSDWSNWIDITECDKQCYGKKTQKRTRSIIEKTQGFDGCPSLTETRTVNCHSEDCGVYIINLSINLTHNRSDRHEDPRNMTRNIKSNEIDYILNIIKTYLPEPDFKIRLLQNYDIQHLENNYNNDNIKNSIKNIWYLDNQEIKTNSNIKLCIQHNTENTNNCSIYDEEQITASLPILIKTYKTVSEIGEKLLDIPDIKNDQYFIHLPNAFIIVLNIVENIIDIIDFNNPQNDLGDRIINEGENRVFLVRAGTFVNDDITEDDIKLNFTNYNELKDINIYPITFNIFDHIARNGINICSYGLINKNPLGGLPNFIRGHWCSGRRLGFITHRPGETSLYFIVISQLPIEDIPEQIKKLKKKSNNNNINNATVYDITNIIGDTFEEFNKYKTTSLGNLINKRTHFKQTDNIEGFQNSIIAKYY